VAFRVPEWTDEDLERWSELEAQAIEALEVGNFREAKRCIAEMRTIAEKVGDENALEPLAMRVIAGFGGEVFDELFS